MVRHWILVITKVYLLWHDLALVEKERASEFEKIKELRKNGQQNEYEKSLTALSNKPIPLSLFCRFESNEEKRLYYSPQSPRLTADFIEVFWLWINPGRILDECRPHRHQLETFLDPTNNNFPGHPFDLYWRNILHKKSKYISIPVYRTQARS